MVCSAKPAAPLCLVPPALRGGKGSKRQAPVRAADDPYQEGTLVRLIAARRTLIALAALGLALTSAPAVAQS